MNAILLFIVTFKNDSTEDYQSLITILLYSFTLLINNEFVSPFY